MKIKPVPLASGDVGKQIIAKAVEEYDVLREQSKNIKKRMDSLASQVKQYVVENGVKDDSGSLYSENDQYIFGQQSRKSVSLDQEKTLAFLKTLGLVDAIKTIEVLDVEAFERYVDSDTISYEDVEKLSTIKVTYAIDIKKKEVMEEAEVFPIAAKRRK